MKKIFVAILFVVAPLTVYSQDFNCFVTGVRKGTINLSLPTSKLIKFDANGFDYFISYEPVKSYGDSIGLFLYKAQGKYILDSALVGCCSTRPVYYQYTADYWIYISDLAINNPTEMAWITKRDNGVVEIKLSFGVGNNYSNKVKFILTPDSSEFGYEIHRCI
jgi:hypothetical protein